jgi:hypothetical protein
MTKKVDIIPDSLNKTGRIKQTDPTFVKNYKLFITRLLAIAKIV